MNLFQFLTADRRLILLLLVGLLALLIGFISLTNDQCLRAIIYGGYWAMLFITVLFGWSLFRVARTDWSGWAAWRIVPRWPAALVAGCGVLLLIHENYGFKILMDEVMLLGTSMAMHFDKLALVPMRGNDIYGAFQVLGGELDKRPLFQPFLVSVLHDLTGYRPENVFVLNTGLTFVLLALAYRTGRALAGRSAGAVAVLLLTSLPLLAQNATGGGFEVLNLVMILATLLLGMRFAKMRDGASLNAFFLSGVLLALTRYESVLFLLPVALVIIWVWWREQRAVLTWPVTFGPLLLVPYALHNHVFSARATAWELGSQPGFDQPFSFAYIPDNLVHALNFFFSPTGEHSNSLVLSLLGFVALPFFVLGMGKTLARLNSVQPERAVLALFSLGFAAHTLLLFCYFWGRFDDPVIRRLSLPLNLLLVLSIIAVAAEFRFAQRGWRALTVLVGLGIFGHSLPAMARHDYTLDYYVGREMEWRREFIAAHPERDYLFIDNNSIIWVTHLISATPVGRALHNPVEMRLLLQNRIYTELYVFQRLQVEQATGELTLPAEDDLGPAYRLETVWERRFTPLAISRISRVAAVDASAPPVPPGNPAPKALDQMTSGERDMVRLEYLRNYIQRLP